jgi:hypothetical protein
MKDLFGEPLPETPAMDAPLPWRVYRLNDCEWWIARSLEEARSSYTQTTGVDGEHAFDSENELTDAQLESLFFVDRDDNDVPLKKSRRTFLEELRRRVAAGLAAPELFASTEY